MRTVLVYGQTMSAKMAADLTIQTNQKLDIDFKFKF